MKHPQSIQSEFDALKSESRASGEPHRYEHVLQDLRELRARYGAEARGPWDVVATEPAPWREHYVVSTHTRAARAVAAKRKVRHALIDVWVRPVRERPPGRLPAR